ncbi:MAG: 3-hydroxyacyl-ACP dehydratase FabZ family protein [Gemmatales bacterium]|nr:beta-hydroxyacyl-ACP dehydratase [Gemmatales bacterium]MDW7993022.1 3-hydroxyacyl-ACP dehydratase FabZ family protein [Gemmatales bacterium]
MRFWLLDGITSYEPGKYLEGYKRLTLAEEYLAEHFPGFPIMPGVLMLEALIQAGAWLIRLTEDFAHSVIILRQAKGIKYGSFVEPGSRLDLRVETVSGNWPKVGEIIWLKGIGEVNGHQAVTARLGLTRYNLGESRPDGLELDSELRNVYRRQYYLLCGRTTSQLG